MLNLVLVYCPLIVHRLPTGFWKAPFAKCTKTSGKTKTKTNWKQFEHILNTQAWTCHRVSKNSPISVKKQKKAEKQQMFSVISPIAIAIAYILPCLFCLFCAGDRTEASGMGGFRVGTWRGCLAASAMDLGCGHPIRPGPAGPREAYVHTWWKCIIIGNSI